MQYAILVYETPEALARREDPAQHAATMAPWARYAQALREAGVLAGGEVLRGPHTATSVRQREGEVVVHDAPASNLHEQLGGLFVVDVPDLDAALQWAERCPCVAEGGTAEVRPIGAGPLPA